MLLTNCTIEDLWHIFSEVFDACFPDVSVLAVFQLSPGRFLLVADAHSLRIVLADYASETELHLRKIAWIHQILDSLEE